jgi:hypothetical protein
VRVNADLSSRQQYTIAIAAARFLPDFNAFGLARPGGQLSFAFSGTKRHAGVKP